MVRTKSDTVFLNIHPFKVARFSASYSFKINRLQLQFQETIFLTTQWIVKRLCANTFHMFLMILVAMLTT